MARTGFRFTALIASALVALASQASAATLNGASFRVDYLYPNTSTVYSDTNGPIFGTVGDGVDATIRVENVTDIALDFSDLSLSVLLTTVLSSPVWNTDPFNGLRITFTDLPASFTGFSLTDATFSPITPSFSDNALFLSWPGAGYVDGSSASFDIGLGPIAAVPVPASLPLVLAGLGAFGALRLRKSRRAATRA